MTGQVKPEGVAWGDGRKGNARSESLFVLFLEFITWMVKSLMEVAVTPSVSHIEGIAAKGFTEGLHCDVLKLFSFAFPVHASSWTRLGFRRTEASQATNSLRWRLSVWWFNPCFWDWCCDGLWGRFGCQNRNAPSFNTSFREALTSHDGANSFYDEIVYGMSCCKPEIHHPYHRPPSLLSFVPWHVDAHFGNWLCGFWRTAISCTLVACQLGAVQTWFLPFERMS